MQAVSKHGIVGRGVLLDVYSWAQKNGEFYDPLASPEITLNDLKEVAKNEGVKFEVGDILLVRSGYTAWCHELEKDSPDRLLEAGVESPTLAGVEPSEEMKTWLHDKYGFVKTLWTRANLPIAISPLLEAIHHLSKFGQGKIGSWYGISLNISTELMTT